MVAASEKFYDELSESVQLSRFGSQVGDDNDFDSTGTDILFETPDNVEFLQVNEQ
jgi:hypothetical protein